MTGSKRSRSRVAVVATLLGVGLGIGGLAGADQGDDVGSLGGVAAPTGVGARVAAPALGELTGRRLSTRLDGRLGIPAGGVGAQVRGSRSLVGAGAVALPTSMGGPVQEKTTPYRVEPRDANGNPPNPWDLPPEQPDPRDFEDAEVFDALASPHYLIREEIWNNPEDLITESGLARYGGVAYVPFWGRNTIRWGRFSVFPFAHVEGVWHSDLGGGEGRSREVFEVMTSVGALGEYWFRGGKTKLKMSARADYRWYDEVYDPAYTYVGGAAIETRLSAYHTVEVGGEVERARRAFDLDTTLGEKENLFQRESIFANGRWDRFLSNDLRLEVGAAYSWLDELDADVNGGDYTGLDAFARLGWAIMRHESFAYLEGRYEERDAASNSDSSDLDHAYEVRAGVQGIQPFGRTRRVVGNMYAGWRTEQYTASTTPTSVGRGRDDTADVLTLGADLTYRPTPYTSGYLSFSRSNAFSAVANYNTVDTLTLAVTQNLSRRVVGRVAVTGTRIEPQDRSESYRASAGVGVRWVVSDNVDATADYEYAHRFEGSGFSEADAHRVAVGLTFHLR